MSAYLSAKLSKLYGISTLVLQNMLNTPRLTWGIRDLAKSRTLLPLVKKMVETALSHLPDASYTLKQQTIRSLKP